VLWRVDHLRGDDGRKLKKAESWTEAHDANDMLGRLTEDLDEGIFNKTGQESHRAARQAYHKTQKSQGAVDDGRNELPKLGEEQIVTE
jgi:hypothetical protein